MPSILWERVAALQGLLNTATACHCSPALQPGLHTGAGRGSRQSLFSHLYIYIYLYISICLCMWMNLGLCEHTGICKGAHVPPAGMQGWHMVGTCRQAGVGLIGLLGLGMAGLSWFAAGKGIIYGCVS